MKKILIVTHAIDVGGVGTSLINISNKLIEIGHDVTIVSTSNRDTNISNINSKIKVIVKDEKLFPLLKKIKGIKHFYDSGCWFKRQSPKKLYKYFVGKDKKFDIEIAFFYGRPVKVIYGSTNKNSKKIVWIHSDFKKCSGFYGGFKNNELAKVAYKNFNHIIAVSKTAEESFREVTGIIDGVKTIYNLNNIKKIKKLADENILLNKNKFTVIAVGRLSEEKAFDRLIDAGAMLIKEGFNLDIWIIGEGPERKKLENKICEYNLNNITLFGNQSNPFPYIKKSDLLVCSSFFEGYNLAVAESIILGTPVLSTKCTGPVEILDNGKYGMIVKNSTEGIFKGLKTIIEDKKLYNHYKQMAEKRKGFFEEETIIKKIKELFE